MTLNRPAAANAFDTSMARDPVRRYGALALDPGDVRRVAMTGRG